MKQQITPINYNPTNGTDWPVSTPIDGNGYREMYPMDVWSFNPWTRKLRDARDVVRDPKGVRILPPGEERVAARKNSWIDTAGKISDAAGQLDVRVNQLWQNKAVGQNIVRSVSVEPHRVLVERADGQRYFVARDKLHVHWSLHSVDVNSPEYMAAQRRLTDFEDAALDAARARAIGDLLVESHPAAVKTLMRLGYSYEGGEEWKPPLGKAPAASAPEILDVASGHMRDRAATYDKPEGERSMGKTVAAFNVITGRDIAESEGWLLMQILKDVRDRQREAAHRDSLEDGVAYAALKAEARLAGR